LPNREPIGCRIGQQPPLAARLSAAVAVWAAGLAALAGWQRFAVAFAAGLLSVAALAPFYVWPVLYVSLPTLIWLIDGAVGHAVRRSPECGLSAPSWTAARAAAAVGWWFGFGYFVGGLYWVGDAFLVEAEVFAPLLPLAVTLLPAGLALFYALAAGLASRFWRPGAARVLALALSLSAMEYARGHLLTGFPWNVLGYALTYPLSLLQSAALIGIYGLTLVGVGLLAAPLILLAEAAPDPAGRRRRALALALGTLPVLAMAAWGHLRLAGSPTAMVAGVKLRIVQPSVPQREKWRPENQERIFLDHLQLSASNAAGQPDGLAGITHVVWPEAAMPFLPVDHPAARAAIGRLLPPATVLIAGGLRAEEAAPGSSVARRIFNSLLVFGDRGRLLAAYDKVHLVPFGEYLPFQAALETIGLQSLTRRRGGFSRGVVPRPLLHLPGLPALAPLICYEAIFPSAVVAGPERPALLLNLTNDGWFGNTTGPRQHMQQARVRAVEEGLPLLRVANNGISAMVDGYGRVLVELGLDQRGSADTGLPAPLPPTPYARFGDGIFLGLWLLGAALLAVCTQPGRGRGHGA
jgi:apolipoprotein N-acyltransferase